MRLERCDLRVSGHCICGTRVQLLISNSCTSLRRKVIALLFNDLVSLVDRLVTGKASLSIKTKLFTAL